MPGLFNKFCPQNLHRGLDKKRKYRLKGEAKITKTITLSIMTRYLTTRSIKRTQIHKVAKLRKCR